MKAWLPILLKALPEAPVLALSNARNLAKAAVLDRNGNVLAGSLGSPALTTQAVDEARLMTPGECRLVQNPSRLILECLTDAPSNKRFWSSATENQEGAWASWLLTMPRLADGALTMSRHLLSAFGPWTTPRLPQEHQEEWSLLPLKAGLGRLFIIGDDALALETAALGARAGLTVTWLSTTDQSGPELDDAQEVGEFDIRYLNGWDDITLDLLSEIGIKDGVRLVVTTADHESFLEPLKSVKSAYLSLAGEAEADYPRGLFLNPLTISQKALGLVAEMLC